MPESLKKVILSNRACNLRDIDEYPAGLPEWGLAHDHRFGNLDEETPVIYLNRIDQRDGLGAIFENFLIVEYFLARFLL